MAGSELVIVEDVTTTGGSAFKAAQALRAEGATILRVITVVDRRKAQLMLRVSRHRFPADSHAQRFS